uniref:Si:ch211-106h11.1 n=1 Tax=Sinocyclocheilus rhinocerous TaxID=307959 RepID=A0A673NC68_9TELE
RPVQPPTGSAPVCLPLTGQRNSTAGRKSVASLGKMHLYHCTASVEPGALQHLQEHLENLHLTFTQAAEIPVWVYSLRGLQELHLTGRLSNEGGMGRGWALGSLRQLRHLRILVLRGMRLTGLAEVQLHGCQLERLPSALLALTGLRSLDLQHNSLHTLEELLGLQHLRCLSCLRLAHNRVLALPASVGVLRSLELLDLVHNQLQNLPSALFIELDLSANRLERLPKELFESCTELRSLNVANNSLGSLPAGFGGLTQLSRLDVRGNSLEELPVELGCCFGLHGGGMLVENWLLHTLPRQVRDVPQHPSSCPSSEPPSRPNSDCFPTFSAAQWSFESALESRI